MAPSPDAHDTSTIYGSFRGGFAGCGLYHLLKEDEFKLFKTQAQQEQYGVNDKLKQGK